MQHARYFLPDHPRLTEVYGKPELRAMLQNGELSRSDMVCDDETGLAHFLGDLLATPYPDATLAPSRSTSSSVPPPPVPIVAQEFRANTPLQQPESQPQEEELFEEDDDVLDPEDEDESELLDDPVADDEDEDAMENASSLTDDEEAAEKDLTETEEPSFADTLSTPPAESEYLPGEESLLYVGHPSWKAYPKALVAFLLLAAGGVLCFQRNFGLEWVTFLGSVAGLIIVFIWLDRTTTTFYVTTRRVELEFGIVGRNSKEVRIIDIRAIDVLQKGYSALVGVGTVSFDSSASAGVEVWFKDVNRPHDIKQLVRQLQG